MDIFQPSGVMQNLLHFLFKDEPDFTDTFIDILINIVSICDKESLQMPPDYASTILQRLPQIKLNSAFQKFIILHLTYAVARNQTNDDLMKQVQTAIVSEYTNPREFILMINHQRRKILPIILMQTVMFSTEHSDETLQLLLMALDFIPATNDFYIHLLRRLAGQYMFSRNFEKAIGTLVALGNSYPVNSPYLSGNSRMIENLRRLQCIDQDVW